MAKKLNKKVAIIGIVIISVVVVLVIAAFSVQKWRKNPARHIAKAEKYLAENDIENAAKQYVGAYSKSKKKEKQLEYLYKAADLFEQIQDWDSVMGCFNKAITLDTSNWTAREKIIDYLTERANSGEIGIWTHLEKNLDDYVDAKKDANEEVPDKIYYLKGKAAYIIASLGGTKDIKTKINESIEMLEKAIELGGDIDGSDIHLQLALATILKGQNDEGNGILGEEKRQYDAAAAMLKEYADENPDDPKAQINLLAIKARGSREEILAAEAEYLRLNEQFVNNEEVMSATLNFYDTVGMKKKAYTYAEKLLNLPSNDNTINYQIAAARLAYENYLITGDESFLQTAIDTAEKALLDPKTQDEKSKTRAANVNRKFMLNRLLAQIYIEQAINNPLEKDEWVQKAQVNIHNIKQILGTTEDPQVIKWDGLATYASGNKTEGLKLMYSAYDKMKASGKNDSFLSLMLAKAFMTTSELGAVNEFLSSAFSDRTFLFTRPDVLLQFIPMIARGNANNALTALDTYELIFGEDEKSKALRTQAYLLSGQIEKAQDVVSQMPANDPNRISLEIALSNTNLRQQNAAAAQLQASIANGQTAAEQALKNVQDEIKKIQENQADLINKLIDQDPQKANINYFTSLIDYYVANNQLIKANDIQKKFSNAYPDESMAKIYNLILMEAEPNTVKAEKINQITEQVLSEIDDPTDKHISLARFYQEQGKLEQAISEYNAVLAAEPNNPVAIDSLFEIAIAQNDIKMLEELTASAEKYNLDQCNGLFYSARLSIVNQQYPEALEKLDKCIEERPVFSLGLFMRSKVYAAENNYTNAIEDATKAISLNPLNREYSKNLALILYQRNMSLGDNVSQEQVTQAKTAIKQAFGLNPSDQGLQLLYADYIGQSEPENAVALLQSLQKQSPNVDTANRIAITAMRIASKNNPPVPIQTRDAMLEIAEAALKQALELDPSNQNSMRLYTELLQVTDRQAEAESIAEKDPQLLWKYYIQNGKYEDAQKLLEDLYKQDTQNEEILSGLLLVAEKTSNQEAVQKYSGELVALKPDDVEKNLFQIRSYIEVNLLDQAEKKLQSFRERFPQESRGLLLSALVDMRNSRLEKALESVNEALKYDTENAQGWRLRGEINYLLANFENAIDDLRKAKTMTPSPEIRIALAKAYIQNNQERDAITELQVAIKDPQTPLSGWILLENLFLKMDNRGQIEDFYAQALEATDNNPFWQNRYAAYLFGKKDYAKARELYLQSWNSSNKQNADAFIGYLNTLIETKDYDKVVSFASKEIDGSFSIPALVYTAQAKIQLDNEPEAMDLLLRAFDKSSENFYAASETTMRIADMLSVDKTKDLISKAISAEPASLPLKYGLFALNIKEENFDSALNLIQELLDAAKDENEISFLQQNKTDALQTAFQKTGKQQYFDDVLKQYEQALSVNPDDLRTLNNAAYIIAQSGKDLDKAMEYAQKAYNSIPNNPGIMDTYAFVLLKKGEYQAALDLLIKSKQIFEKQSAFAPADLYDHLGIANEKLGNKEMAISSYKQAVEVGKEQLSPSDMERIKRAIENLENN